MQPAKPARWGILLATIALTYLVCAVFFPIVGFVEFVNVDVGDQVVNNRDILGLSWENIKHIFSSWCISSYYPLRTLTYAIDYQIWGLNPGGFKLTNGLIHLANVLLVFCLILRLFRQRPGVPAAAYEAVGGWREVAVAAFSAGIFAVHPVVVQPVAWVPGREELLMTLGALGSIHFHITARRLGARAGMNRWALACYVAAALSCAAACLSNAVAAVIPLLIVAWDVLMLPQRRLWRILSGTSALWAISAATIVIKKVGDSIHHGDSAAGQFELSWLERLMLVLKVFGLNLQTLFWPTRLALRYEKVLPWNFLDADVILGAVAIGLICVIFWAFRRQKLLVFGLVWFGLALGPTSQIMPHHIHRADRYLYLPLAGLAMAVAAGLRRLVPALKGLWPTAGGIAAGIAVLLLLDVLSARQVWTWKNTLSAWQHCVEVVPNSAQNHYFFADRLAEAGQLAGEGGAFWHYRKALSIDSNHVKALNNYANYLVINQNKQPGDYELAIKLAKRACELSGWKDPKFLRTLAIAHFSLAMALEEQGQFSGAVENYNEAIRTDPDYDRPQFYLAWLLATCSDPGLRQPEKAVELAERAYQLTQRPDAHRLNILAEVYAGAERFQQAIEATEKAIQLAQAAGNLQMADVLRGRLKQYHQQLGSSSTKD